MPGRDTAPGFCCNNHLAGVRPFWPNEPRLLKRNTEWSEAAIQVTAARQGGRDDRPTVPPLRQPPNVKTGFAGA